MVVAYKTKRVLKVPSAYGILSHYHTDNEEQLRKFRQCYSKISAIITRLLHEIEILMNVVSRIAPET